MESEYNIFHIILIEGFQDGNGSCPRPSVTNEAHYDTPAWMHFLSHSLIYL